MKLYVILEQFISDLRV